MRIFITLILSSILSLSSFSQVEGTEIGVDGFFGASTNGGGFSIGGKYGMIFKENMIVGPSIRYQRYWNKNILTSQSSGFNVFGGGVFGHYRLFDVLFVGAEVEFLRTPNSVFISSSGTPGSSNWVPTVFLGGGYSQAFNEKIRLNVGIMYDIIDRTNSPFRTSYFLKRANGSLVPLIYRVALFFPIG